MGDLKPAQDGISVASNSIPGADRPLVTFALFAYNQEPFIREAVEGAFAQTYEPLEIILSDDCSTDGTFRIMQEMAEQYVGPHTLILNRNPVNLGLQGIGAHINQVFDLSRGELFVLAAGDDISLPERAAKLVETWIAAGRPQGSIHSAVEVFLDRNHGGTVHEGLKDYNRQSVVDCIRAGGKGVTGASHAVTRGVFERFGPLPDDTLTEDLTLAFRSLLIGDVVYCPRVLLRYRRSGDNLSGSENYTNAWRWNRWINGMLARYRTFQKDYELVTPAERRDPRVYREIRRGIQRAERSRLLISNSFFRKLIGASYYSAEFRFSDRLPFILQRVGLQESLLYRGLAFVRRSVRKVFG